MMQKNLSETQKLLANTEEELKKCQYSLREKDYIISQQKKAGLMRISPNIFEICVSYDVLIMLTNVETENALTHQACILRSDLEKALRDNALLFQKIGMLLFQF